MRITSGDADGLSLVPHDGDTDKEVPEGAYTIEALKTGTYTFYFYIVGHENEFKTETFTLEVLEPISADEYKANLIGKTYEYNTGTMEYSLKFENETTMVLTMPTVSGDREEGDTPSESGEVSVNIKYQISDGRVTVLSDAADGVNQIFNSNDSYYESVYAGDIDISEDYRNVTLQLRLRSDAETYVTGVGSMSTLKLTFADTTGTFELRNNTTSSLVCSYSFEYSVDAATGAVVLSNVTLVESTIENIEFVSASMSNNILSVVLKVPTNFGYSLDHRFDLDLRNPL